MNLIFISSFYYYRYRASPANDTWTSQDLMRFLEKSQKQAPATVQECDGMIEAFEPLKEYKEKHLLSEAGKSIIHGKS